MRVLTLFAGIGVFLIACQMMSSNLEAASSERLKKIVIFAPAKMLFFAAWQSCNLHSI